MVRIASTAVFLAVSAIAMATYAFYQQRGGCDSQSGRH